MNAEIAINSQEALLGSHRHGLEIVQLVTQSSSDKEICWKLAELPDTAAWLKAHEAVAKMLSSLEEIQQKAVLQVIALRQGSSVIHPVDHPPPSREIFTKMAEHLTIVDRFFRDMGGLAGYHTLTCELIAKARSWMPAEKLGAQLSAPPLIDLAQFTEAKRWTKEGLNSLPQTAEIYVVGGAGDRLNLQDSETGIPLPAAMLRFNGKTLLEGLLRDLQAKEHLYYKLTGDQITIPVALMTSYEKDNHRYITKNLEEVHWCNRPRESFHFFTQPLIPVIAENGSWSAKEAAVLTLKPGGHGPLWLLAEQSGLFTLLAEQGISYVLVRQINNPLAGLGCSMLSLLGYGAAEGKAFGLLTCQRRVGAPEGMIVLSEREGKSGITNVEYTDFGKLGIEDTPASPDGLYSAYPANINLLFAHLPSLEGAIRSTPLPGLLVNLKKKAPIFKQGEQLELPAGRLEAAMQSLADAFADKGEDLSTFALFCDRKKNFAPTKKAFTSAENPLDTPQMGFYCLQRAWCAQLAEWCQGTLPKLGSPQEYLSTSTPPLLLHLHPALSLLGSVLAQKVQKVTLQPHSELHLDIVEAKIEALYVDGSLVVEATAPLGHLDQKGHLHYSNQSGKCLLHNVRIENRGLAANQPDAWQGSIDRQESCRITIHGSGELVAENVTIQGDYQLEVPHATRITLQQGKKGVEKLSEHIDQPTWQWDYAMQEDGAITLQRAELPEGK